MMGAPVEDGMGEPTADDLRAGPGPLTPRELSAHITALGPRVWEIDAVIVSRGLDELVRPTRRDRIVPIERDGAPAIRLFGVRSSTPLGHLGFRNGDVITSINDVPVGDPAIVTSLFQGNWLREAFFVRLIRGGTERVHVYRIRD